MINTRRAFLSFAATAFTQAAEPQLAVPTYNTLSDAEEVALGRQIAAATERDLPVLQIAALDNYVNSLVAELGRRSRRSNLRYTAKVVNTVDVNAVSLPGGFLYVFRGLLESVQNESELVGVLAHEVGHIVGRHSANQMMLNFKARQLYEVVRKNLELQNTVIPQIIEQLGGAAVVLANLRYGREQEFEADMLGFYNMIRAGWDGDGMTSFFRRTDLSKRGEANWLDDALATHPSSAERVQRIRAEAAQLRMPADLRTNSLSFQTMKLGLRLLPAPVRPRAKR